MKMWSGRFRQPLDPAFEAWQRSWEFDCRLLECELEASSAHARALAKADILSADELKTILNGLEEIGERVAKDPELLEDGEVEDVHHFVEKLLVALIGDLGYKLHSGRSRNEQIATDLRLYTRAACDEISAELSKLISTLIDRAEKAGDAAMPAYTHLQPAEPVLVAHWLLAYAEMFLRDLQRLEDCRKRLNACPLGSGAVAGTTLPLDRELMSAELGFLSPTANSIDATCDRDFVIEFANTSSLLAIHLSRWAEEMLLFSTQEYGFIRPPEAFSTGSSAMVANLDYSDYLGRLAIARVFNGTLRTGEEVAIAKLNGSFEKTRITKLFSFAGLKRLDITETALGDIVAVAGVEGITIGETITNVENPAPLPPITIDEPTIAMSYKG